MKKEKVALSATFALFMALGAGCVPFSGSSPDTNAETPQSIDFKQKESRYAQDNTTEVLIDDEIGDISEIDHYYKHGDHWHVFTKDGKEHIVYKDPSKASNLASLGSTTSVVSKKELEKIDPSSVVKILKHGDHWHIYTAGGYEYVSYTDPSSMYPHIKQGVYTGSHGSHGHKPYRPSNPGSSVNKPYNPGFVPVVDVGSTVIKEKIVKILKHGDHYHMYTNTGKEYITYDDPSKKYPHITIGTYVGNHGDNQGNKPNKPSKPNKPNKPSNPETPSNPNTPDVNVPGGHDHGHDLVEVVNDESKLRKLHVKEIKLHGDHYHIYTIEGKEVISYLKNVPEIFKGIPVHPYNEVIDFATDVLPNIKKIYEKKGNLYVRWWHVNHMHNDAVVMYNYLENKIKKAPENFKPSEAKKIEDDIASKDYYVGPGCIYYVEHIEEIDKGIFDKVEKHEDIVNVVYKGKEYTITVKEFEMANLEKEFRPSSVSNISIDPKFDFQRKITLHTNEASIGYNPWACWSDGNGDDLEELNPNFDHYEWFIVRANEKQYTKLSNDSSPSFTFTREDNNALIKLNVVDKDGQILDQVKYELKVIGELQENEVSEHTKERIYNAKRIFIKNGAVAFKWWHVNHWHYELIDYYDDLKVVEVDASYDLSNAKKIRELALDESLLDRIYYIEDDRIIYKKVSRAEFIKEKLDEIVSRIHKVDEVKDSDRDTILLHEYTHNDQTAEVNRLIELYNKLEGADKKGLEGKVQTLLTLAKEKEIKLEEEPETPEQEKPEEPVIEEPEVVKHKVSFKAVFEDDSPIPSIGVWYLTGTNKYVDRWKDASTDAMFGDTCRDEFGHKEARYLRPNTIGAYTTRMGKETIEITNKTADYIYVRVVPRPGEELVRLTVNDREIEGVKVGRFESNPIRIDVNEDLVVKMVCRTISEEDEDDVQVEEQAQPVDMKLVGYYTNEEGEKVYADPEDANLRFSTKFVPGKPLFSNEEVKNFITKKYKGGVATEEKRNLTGNFSALVTKSVWDKKTIEGTSTGEYNSLNIGDKGTNSIIVFFEYSNEAVNEVNKPDANKEEVVEASPVSVKVIGYYTNDEGEKVYADPEDANLRFNTKFVPGKPLFSNEEVKNFITKEHKGGAALATNRKLTGKFSAVVTKSVFNRRTIDANSVAEYESLTIGDKNTSSIIVFFEYENNGEKASSDEANSENKSAEKADSVDKTLAKKSVESTDSKADKATLAKDAASSAKAKPAAEKAGAKPAVEKETKPAAANGKVETPREKAKAGAQDVPAAAKKPAATKQPQPASQAEASAKLAQEK